MKIGDADFISIGITGTIGSGKSLAGKFFQEMNIPVIDTDKIVHELLAKDKETKSQIKAHFPEAIKPLAQSEDFEINRKVLGQIIFKDKKAKASLEAILHPKVRQVCRQRVANLVQKDRPKAIATLVPLLFEANRQSDYDQVWTIYCDETILRERLSKRDGLNKEEIDARLAGQLSQTDKCRLADKVLDNSGAETRLRMQIVNYLKELHII